MLQTDDTAPDFTLVGTRGDGIQEFTLSEVADERPTMLVFYIYDFSPACTTQICEINDMELLTLNDDVAVLGISSDGPYSHQQFIDQNNISYPLLTDDEKRVHEQYGMLEQNGDGTRQAKRGLVLIDTDQTVRYQWTTDNRWGEWRTSPLQESYEVIRQLTGRTDSQ